MLGDIVPLANNLWLVDGQVDVGVFGSNREPGLISGVQAVFFLFIHQTIAEKVRANLPTA